MYLIFIDFYYFLNQRGNLITKDSFFRDDRIQIFSRGSDQDLGEHQPDLQPCWPITSLICSPADQSPA